MFVACEYCVVVQVDASATGRSLVQGSPTEYVSLNVIKGYS